MAEFDFKGIQAQLVKEIQDTGDITSNPFTGEFAGTDPFALGVESSLENAKFRQEDFFGLARNQAKKNPLVSSDQAKNEIDSFNDTANNIFNKKKTANDNAISNDLIKSQTEKYQTAYDEESAAVNTYYDDTIDETKKMFDSISTELSGASDALIQSLKDIYEQRGNEMKILNKATLGGLTKSGIRSGRNRYAPVIESGILSAEESAGINRIKTLQAEEANLIAQAQMAKSKEDWKMFNEYRSSLTLLHEKKLTALSDQLAFATNTENLANLKSTNALGKLKEIASVGGTISLDMVNQVDTIYGEGFAQRYVDASKLAQEATSKEDQLDLAQKLVNLLNDIPEGEQFPFDGKTYTGLKTEDPNTKEWLEQDSSGQYQVISFNQDTNEVTVKGTDVKGKLPSSGGGGGLSLPGGLSTIPYKGGAISVPAEFVDNIGDDNFVNTDVYKSVRNRLTKSTDRTLFDDNYRFLLNPSDFTAVDLALPKTFNDEQQVALEAGGGVNWMDLSAQRKLEILTEYEKNKRKELGIGQGNVPSYGGGLDDDEEEPV